MNRTDVINYIEEAYYTKADFPWAKSPNYAVFRHSDNKKWFALIMDVPKEKLEPSESGMIDIMNVKCDSIMIGSFRMEAGIYPAYHMSKSSWLSVSLDGSVDDEKIKLLLDMSFELTSVKQTKNKKLSRR